MKKAVIFKVLYWSIIIVHYFAVLCFMLTALLGWKYMPWYQYITMLSLILRVIYSKDICPLTSAENCIAEKLSYTKSRGFIISWIIVPGRKLWK